MPSYLVESCLGRSPEALDEACSRARLTADRATGVRYVRTTFVPEDEIVLHLFEAPSAEALDHAGRRAALRFERIVEAVEGVAGSTKEER